MHSRPGCSLPYEGVGDGGGLCSSGQVLSVFFRVRCCLGEEEGEDEAEEGEAFDFDFGAVVDFRRKNFFIIFAALCVLDECLLIR